MRSLESNLPELSRALTHYGYTVYPFAMALFGNSEFSNKEIKEVLWFALESDSFVANANGLLEADELELLNKIFVRAKSNAKAIVEESVFFKLNLEERAAIFLRTKNHLSWEDIGIIIEKNKEEVVSLVSRAREKLLGRLPIEIEEELLW